MLEIKCSRKTRVMATLWDEEKCERRESPSEGYIDGYVYSVSKDCILAVVVADGRLNLCFLSDLELVKGEPKKQPKKIAELEMGEPHSPRLKKGDRVRVDAIKLAYSRSGCGKRRGGST